MKALKSLGMVIGLFVINNLIIAIVSVVFAIFIKNPKEISQYIYIITCIGDIITLIFLYLIVRMYDKSFLNKKTFKKLSLKELTHICSFGFGFSIILLILTGILAKLIPSYMSVQNQLQSISGSLFQLIIIIIIIPIYEEIVFRGIVFGYLKNNFNIICAVIVQALFFGLVHLNIVQGIYTFLLGVALALVYMYSESLVGSIILHIIFNLCGVLLVPKLVSINPIMEYIIIIFGIVCLAISVLKITKEYKKVLYK